MTTELDISGSCVADDQAASINCSLRSAIEAAGSNTGPDTIVIPDGNYVLDSGFSIDDQDDLTFIGNSTSPANVVIDTQSNDRVFDIFSSSQIEVTIDGVTIQNGRAFDGSGGGGINANSSISLTIRNTVFRDNIADIDSFSGFGSVSNGGAIDALGPLSLRAVQFIENTATGYGGAINWLPSGTSPQLVIEDTVFLDNEAEIDGGGLAVDTDYALGFAEINIDGSRFESNQAGDSGGGIFILGGNLSVDASEFLNNETLGVNDSDGVGGGLYYRAEQFGESFVITDTLFEGNRSVGAGAGLLLRDGDGSLATSTFVNNVVNPPTATGNPFPQGGGGAAIVGLSSVPSVTGSELIFERNQAPAGGGLVLLDANLTLSDSQWSDNIATRSDGGGGAIGGLSSFVDPLLLRVTNSSITDNLAAGAGGGIAVVDYDVELVDVSIESNQATADRGGGVAVAGEGRRPSVLLDTVTLSANEANGDGGGFYLGPLVVPDPFLGPLDFAAPLRLVNSTIVGNQSLGSGGGLHAPGPLVIESSTISNNFAQSEAGGIQLGIADFGTYGSLSITDSNIRDNRTDGGGGGISIESAGNAAIEATMIDTEISGNNAESSGGGINVYDMSLTLERTIFQGNTSSRSSGGALSAFGDLTVVDSTFEDNQAGINGGAIESVDSDLNIRRSQFANNSAVQDGGAIIVSGESTLIEQSLFTENSAGETAGALYFASSSVSPAEARIINTTFSANTATNSGAIFVTDADATILQSTITQNQADSGGGIVFDQSPGISTGSVSLGNTLIAGNSVISSNPDVDGSFISLGGNLIGNVADAVGFSEPMDQVGNDAAPIDPLLGPLQLFQPSDPFASHRPLPGSPAIDRGISTLGVLVDQRDVSRPIDGTGDGVASFDIGAIEAEQPEPLANNDFFQVDSNVGTVPLDVLANDFEPVSNPFTISSISQSGFPIRGQVLIAADGRSLFYTPPLGFVGQDQFLYIVTPQVGGPQSALVTVEVVGLAPVLTFTPDPSVSAETDVPLTVDGTSLTANDIAGSGPDPVRIESVSANSEQGGTVTLVGQNLTYTSATGYIGSDRIFYTITDGSEIVSATLTVDVAAPPSTGTIVGQIVCDANGNFQLDAGEQVSGASVFVDLNRNGRFDSGEPSSITDADGRYSIAIDSQLIPNDFHVLTTVPLGCRTITPLPAVIRSDGVGLMARSLAVIPQASSMHSGPDELVVVNELSGDLSFVYYSGGSLEVSRSSFWEYGGRLTSVDVFQPSDPFASPTMVIGDVGTTAGGRVILHGSSGVTEIPVADGPIDVKAADFNNDDLPDILVSSLRGSQLSIIWGGEEQVTPLTTTRNLVDSVTGDFNGDGFLDIAIGGSGLGIGSDAARASEIKVLLGNGDDSFLELEPLSLPAGVLQLETFDFTDNAQDELMVLGRGGQLHTVAFDGSQLQVIANTQLDSDARAFVLGNFNGDGLIDLAYTRPHHRSIQFMVGNSSGQFVRYSEVFDVDSPADMVAVDLTGDGVDELAVANLFTTCEQCDQAYSLPSTVTMYQLNVAVQSVSVPASGVASADFLFPSADPDVLLDVNEDGQVSATDALMVINALAQPRQAEAEAIAARLCLKRGLTLSGDAEDASEIVSPPKGQTPFKTELSRFNTDVNRDGQTTALDALIILNWLNEGERLAIDDGAEAEALPLTMGTGSVIDGTLNSETQRRDHEAQFATRFAVDFQAIDNGFRELAGTRSIEPLIFKADETDAAPIKSPLESDLDALTVDQVHQQGLS